MSRTDSIARLRSACRERVGAERVFDDRATLLCHSYDAYVVERLPDLVVYARSAQEVAALVAAARAERVPFTARGSGTGYAGGAIAVEGGLLIALGDMRSILSVDRDRGRAWVEPGVTTAALARAAEDAGWRYPPDPSSHQVCSIGGNVATNAGGPHCLGHGVTTSYILELEVVTPAGEIIRVGGDGFHAEGLDLRGLMVGSEGTLGIVTSIGVRLVRPPEMARTLLLQFAETGAALSLVSSALERGLGPAALDMSGRAILLDDGAEPDQVVLFVEVEGFAEEVVAKQEAISRLARELGGTVEVPERAELMLRRAELVRRKVRRMVRATGRDRYFLFDAVVPPSRLRECVAAIEAAALKHQLPLLNTFHAGDGNVHPTPFFDPADPSARQPLEALWREVLLACRDLGGSLSGEHGIGVEKREMMAEFFAAGALRVMRRLRDGFDPEGLCNPGKVLPQAEGGLPPPLPLENGPRLEVRCADALVSVDAKVRVSEVVAALAETPFELPYDPLDLDPDPRLLDALLAGSPGLRELRFGPSRDVVLGGELVLPGGERLRFGSTMAKDVAGYDLRKLVFGSRGRLGTLARAHLRLRPRLAARLWGRVTAQGGLEGARALVRRLFALRLPWSSLALCQAAGAPPALELLLEGPEPTLRRAREQIAGHLDGAAVRWSPEREAPTLAQRAGPGEALRVGRGHPDDAPSLDPAAGRAMVSFAGAGTTVWLVPRAAASDSAPPQAIAALERVVEEAFRAR